MFKVEATDELENPTGDDIRVALAVGTNAANTTTAPIKLWCKTASDGSAAWVDLASAVETGSWVRATLVLDYSASKCSVSLNGDPVLNGTDKWFYFANSSGDASYVSSITMVGSTLVDDLVVEHGTSGTLTPAGATGAISGSAVTYDYINKYGVTTNQVATDAVLNEASGMKISEKFEAGLDPKSATQFALQSMTMGENTVTVKFPGTKGNGNYKVKVSTTKGGAAIAQVASVQTSADGEGENSATVNLSSEISDEELRNGLLYFTVETGSIE
jgi:hypothetical protein